MPYINCKICSQRMYAKPRHLKNGWGKYCSKICQNEAQKKGMFVACAHCGQKIYRTEKNVKHSKSGNFFCNKSCLAIWKNKHIIIGEQHPRWKHGENAYRNIMKRDAKEAICVHCGIKNFIVLLVHHIDRNRKNNHVDNLLWLCHNCHFLEHRHDKIKRNMETLV